MVSFANVQSADRMIFSIFNRSYEDTRDRTLRVFTQVA